MRKREREELSDVCHHYHNQEGVICGVCGHVVTSKKSQHVPLTSSPSEILPDFLYLDGFQNASLLSVLKFHGISHILNTVPSCPNINLHSFTYHRLENEKALEFDNAIQFLETCEKQRYRVLVHCMSGKSKSPAIVIAYLMKRNEWRLAKSYQWVKSRRPSIDISSEFQQQLIEFEKRLFGSRA